MSDNPYSSPSTISDPEIAANSSGDEFAGRFTRLVAAIIDSILMMAILMPIQYLSGYLERAFSQQAGMVEELAVSFLGMVVMLALNGYLLFTRGQTIGKLLLRIQIVEFGSGELLPFVRVFVFRHLWILPLVLAVILIPGKTDNLLINLVSIIDVLLIFGMSRRCLHDHFAGSQVVIYRADRPGKSDSSA